MGFLTVLYIVFYEVKSCKFIVTMRGSDCQKGGTSSQSLPSCNWLCNPPCGYCELFPWSQQLNAYLHLAKR